MNEDSSTDSVDWSEDTRERCLRTLAQVRRWWAGLGPLPDATEMAQVLMAMDQEQKLNAHLMTVKVMRLQNRVSVWKERWQTLRARAALARGQRGGGEDTFGSQDVVGCGDLGKTDEVDDLDDDVDHHGVLHRRPRTSVMRQPLPSGQCAVEPKMEPNAGGGG